MSKKIIFINEHKTNNYNELKYLQLAIVSKDWPISLALSYFVWEHYDYNRGLLV